jgi:sugar phosphate isomerase/epimerase
MAWRMKAPRFPALSSMWSQLRYADMDSFISAAESMGFPYVELGHVVEPARIEELSLSIAGSVRVLHHPCPNPGGVPQLSDPDQARRRAAVEAATVTIEWAARLGVGVVVTHLGEVAVDRRWENALRARWLQGESETHLYGQLFSTVVRMRQERVGPFLDAARRSLSDLTPLLRERGVRLALENGEWIASLPTTQEARLLLDEFDEVIIGLWLDTGHATILERLGTGSLVAWAQLAPERLSGTHYHDVAGLRDHLIPGNGTIDWAGLAPLIPAHALPTCEFDWYYSSEEVRAGAARLASHGLLSWSGDAA